MTMHWRAVIWEYFGEIWIFWKFPDFEGLMMEAHIIFRRSESFFAIHVPTCPWQNIHTLWNTELIYCISSNCFRKGHKKSCRHVYKDIWICTLFLFPVPWLTCVYGYGRKLLDMHKASSSDDAINSIHFNHHAIDRIIRPFTARLT
jgi:hypothetical protein